MQRTKRLGFMLAAAMVLLTGVVLAQGEPVSPAVNWLAYAAIAINAVLVPAAVQLLKPLWASVPSFVKTLVPLFIGSVLTMGSVYLSEKLGAAVDLSALAEIFMGAIVGAGASMTFKMGAASK